MSTFQPFDSRAPLEKTRRNLPHWHQPGATYFVTFRLADSLPAEARARLSEMRRLNDADAFAWIERYLDAGSGSCLFSQAPLATAVAKTLKHFDGEYYHLGAFVVMPNHVHALVQPIVPSTLTTVLHSWKSYTTNLLRRSGVVTRHLWQEETFDRIVRDESELRRSDAYIRDNPGVARLKPSAFLLDRGTANWLNP